MLLDAVQTKIDPREIDLGDLAHLLTGFGGNDPRVLSRLNDPSLKMRLPRQDLGLAYDLSPYYEEDHLAETIEALTRVVGVNEFLQIAGQRTHVAALVEEEMRSQRLAGVILQLQATAEEKVNQLRVMIRHLDAEPEAITTEDLRAARALQGDLNNLELSWVIQAITRLFAERGDSFDSSWTGANGQEMSLPILLEANSTLYTTDASPGDDVTALTERGYHFLQSLALMFSLFADDETFADHRENFEPIYDHLVEELFFRYDSDEPPRHLSSVDYVIAAHVLEFMNDSSYFKSRVLIPGTEGSGDQLNRTDRMLLQNLAIVERRVGSRETLGFAFAMHALNGLSKMRERVASRGE